MAKLRRKQKKELKRFGQYMVGGGAQFWSGYITYAVLETGLGIDFWPAKIISYFIGVTVNFVIERYWVFKIKGISKKQIETSAERYYGLMFTNFIIDLAIVAGLRELGITPYIGQFIAAGFFTVWNWLLFKSWVFNKQRSPGLPADRRSQSRRKPSRAVAVSKAPVLTQRITNTPRSALRFFLAPASSEHRLKKDKKK